MQLELDTAGKHGNIERLVARDHVLDILWWIESLIIRTVKVSSKYARANVMHALLFPFIKLYMWRTAKWGIESTKARIPVARRVPNARDVSSQWRGRTWMPDRTAGAAFRPQKGRFDGLDVFSEQTLISC